MEDRDDDFHGCKVALFDESQRILVFLRDDDPEIESPNTWDLPGGGREGTESPEDCVLRELKEEFGIALGPERLVYKRRYHREYLGRTAFFFVGSITKKEIDAIVFGDEGQGWSLMGITDYLTSADVVPRHRNRMQDYLTHLQSEL